MINIHFSNEIIYFLARIDQQVKSYRSSRSKQDNTTEQQKKQAKQKNTKRIKQTNAKHYFFTKEHFH